MERTRKFKYLYHATFPTRVDSIREKGIDPRYNPLGFVYLCETVEAIEDFTHGAFNRWAHEVSSTELQDVVTENGEKMQFPKIIYHDKVAVLQIDATKMDEAKIDIGTDHNRNFYQSNVYTYTGLILPEWITGIKYIPFGVSK